MRPNVAFGASNAPKAAFAASNAPKATLGRLRAGGSAGGEGADLVEGVGAGGEQRDDRGCQAVVHIGLDLLAAGVEAAVDHQLVDDGVGDHLVGLLPVA